MSRDFIFRVKGNDLSLPSPDPSGFRVILDETTGFFKLMTSDGNIIDAPIASSFETKIVNITSSQILNMGSSPIELLVAPGGNNYYDIQKIIIEYSFGTNSYEFTSSATFYLDGAFDSYIDKTLITSASNSVCTISGNLRNTLTVGSGSGSVQVKTNKDVLNSNLLMGTPNGDNPTSGDGTIRVIITYSTRAFGQ